MGAAAWTFARLPNAPAVPPVFKGPANPLRLERPDSAGWGARASEVSTSRWESWEERCRRLVPLVPATARAATPRAPRVPTCNRPRRAAVVDCRRARVRSLGLVSRWASCSWSCAAGDSADSHRRLAYRKHSRLPFGPRRRESARPSRRKPAASMARAARSTPDCRKASSRMTPRLRRA